MTAVSLAPPRPSPIAAGYSLDRYELICPIAEGGMASVWIARQTGKHGFRKLVAVKTILPKYAAEPKFQRMFIDEARIASRIEHANVAQILDVGEQHDVTYLVMEYVDGDSLSKISRAAQKKGGQIPLGILLRIMADVCGGLHAAHELRDDDGAPLGVVHRDVSPQNVLVTTRGVAKLIDFGIAKARDRLAGETHGDTLKGKVQYMPPEQALGIPVDRRADVWAVGAVLHHLIAGVPPFEADNEIQTLFLITSGREPSPLPSDVPAPVRDLIKRALAHSVGARYATAAELQQALEDAIVACGLVGSTSSVAAFLEQLVGDRANKRKEAIAVGLKAAEEREKVAAIMRSNAEANGGSDTGRREGAALTQPDMPRLPLSIPEPETTTSPTGQTLGSASMAFPAPHRARGWSLAVAAGALVVGGAIALIASRSSGDKARASAAPVSPPTAEGAESAPRLAPSAPSPPSPLPSETASVASSAPPSPAPPSSGVPASRTPPRSRTPAAAAPSAPAARPTPAATGTHRENYGF
ncbi:MAG: serine/threonine-protein kinase [Polyangiaceae bacterium]